MLTLTHCSGFGGGAPLREMTVVLSGTQYNVDLAAKLTALGWSGVEPVDVTVTVASGDQVGSASAGSYALTVPALPVGSLVKIDNAGRIQGRGGDGASGYGGGGGDGGPALRLQHPTALVNRGVIAGGGGGGAAWGLNGGGGGGAGILGGSGGAGFPTEEGTQPAGRSGTATAGGAGGGSSASGGGPGAGGGSTYASGGAPGNWVTGYAYLTIISNTGTLAGGTA